jgi:hypothetical protein
MVMTMIDANIFENAGAPLSTVMLIAYYRGDHS